jgi:predicted TIM-barrel fold metal-dependent hydrolase
MKKSSGRWDCHAHVFVGAPLPGSHYTPNTCTLAMWQTSAAQHEIEHVVLVQPSVYGTDNSVMLDALLSSNGAHRGVAVVAPDVTERQLEEMHGAGVRGVRFNLVSPMGNDRADITDIAERIRSLGWHLQLFVRPADLAWVAQQQPVWGVPVVLDHMAGLRSDTVLSQDEEANLRALADAGAWVKLSGFYRLAMSGSFTQADERIAQLQEMFGNNTVWGSDWPHTWYMEEANAGGIAPSFEDLIAPLQRALPGRKIQQAIFSEAPASLYG